MTRIGLVLGAGGAVGHAFHAGVLAALTDETGWDARDAEVIVGTSAGSLVGAFLRGGLSAPDLAARTCDAPMSEEGRRLVDRAEAATQHLPPIPSRPPRRQGLPAMSAPGALLRAAFPPWTARPGALAAAMLPEGRISTEIIATGLRPFFDTWPDRALWINAVDLQTSRLVTFGRDNAPMTDVPTAVAASCAIPAFFAPVVIDGVRYVDGGMHSPTNADLLAGLELDLVVVSSPMSIATKGPRFSANQAGRLLSSFALGREVAKVRRSGTPVLVFQPGADDVAVMGLNAMEESRRAPVTRKVFESTLRLLDSTGGADRIAILRSAATSRPA
jgi:NTE family protein